MIYEDSHVARRMIENLPPKLICKIVKRKNSFFVLEGEEKLKYFTVNTESSTFKFSFHENLHRVFFVLFADNIPLGMYTFAEIDPQKEYWVRDVAINSEKIHIEILHDRW